MLDAAPRHALSCPRDAERRQPGSDHFLDLALRTAAVVDVRALPDENIPGLIEEMEKLVNDPAIEIKRTAGNERPASPPSRLDTALYRAMEATAKKMFPNAITMPDMLTGATDSSQLRAKGVQAYGISTPKTDEDSRRVHGNDERTSVAGLNTFTQYLHDVLIAVAEQNH